MPRSREYTPRERLDQVLRCLRSVFEKTIFSQTQTGEAACFRAFYGVSINSTINRRLIVSRDRCCDVTTAIHFPVDFVSSKDFSTIYLSCLFIRRDSLKGCQRPVDYIGTGNIRVVCINPTRVLNVILKQHPREGIGTVADPTGGYHGV